MEKVSKVQIAEVTTTVHKVELVPNELATITIN
jgi:hypothetical protein